MELDDTELTTDEIVELIAAVVELQARMSKLLHMTPSIEVAFEGEELTPEAIYYTTIFDEFIKHLKGMEIDDVEDVEDEK